MLLPQQMMIFHIIAFLFIATIFHKNDVLKWKWYEKNYKFHTPLHYIKNRLLPCTFFKKMWVAFG